jgi:uncharacterized protein
MEREPGSAVRVEMSKWGDRPHWHFAGTYLGRDEHGEWLGFPAGTHYQRPGLELHSAVDTVTLIPISDWCAPTFYAPGTWCELYVDIATPGAWDGDVLRSVDLDLDVVRMSAEPPQHSTVALPDQKAPWGELFIDDEDEFAEHQVAYAYPDEVVRAARDAAGRVLADARARRAPYDGSHRRWLQELSRIASGSAPVAPRD